MKIQSLILTAAFVFTGVFGLNAQDRQNPWTIELGTNAVDFYPVGYDSGTLFPAIGQGRVHGAFINENKGGQIITPYSRIDTLIYDFLGELK